MLKIIGSALRSSSPSSRLISSHFLCLSSSSSSCSRSLSSLSSSSCLTSKGAHPRPQDLQASRSFSSSSSQMSSVAVQLDQDHLLKDFPSFTNTKEIDPVETQQLTKEEEETKLEARAELLSGQLGIAFLLRAAIKFEGRIDLDFQKNRRLCYMTVLDLVNPDLRVAFGDFCYVSPDRDEHLCDYFPFFAWDFDPTKQVISIDESRPDEIPSPQELAEFLEKHCDLTAELHSILVDRLWDLNEELRSKYFHPAFDNPLEVLSLCQPVPQTLENRIRQVFFPIVSPFRRIVWTWKFTKKRVRVLKELWKAEKKRILDKMRMIQ